VATICGRAPIAAMPRRMPARGTLRTRNEPCLWYAYGTVCRP